VLTLHNFIKKPAIQFSGQPIPAKVVRGKKPQVTFPGQNGQPSINALAPQDYAVIYNINPVYAGAVYGSPAIFGVIGRSNLNNSGQDVQNFCRGWLWRQQLWRDNNGGCGQRPRPW
jgi:hypothetical protein